MAVGSLPSSSLAYGGAGDPFLSDSRAWRKFARNPAALLGMLILAVVVGSALAAPWITPGP
jgi:ABC-type antimicrobial peptide transport system permease subunit